MNTFLTVTAAIFILGILGLALLRESPTLRRAMYFGIELWSMVLPLLSVMIYLSILFVNVYPAKSLNPRMLDLSHYFSMAELTVLLCVGPLFLTRFGNLLGLATAFYAVERVALGSSGAHGMSAGLMLLVGSSSIIAVLADRLPWHSGIAKEIASKKLRELLVNLVAVLALGLFFAAILKSYKYADWLESFFGFAVQREVVLAALTLALVGWLGIALGFMRGALLSILLLPTILTITFIGQTPNYALIIPFFIILGLCLATSDHRLLRR